MDTQTLSSIAQRGQSQLEGTVAAARNVLSHFAADVSSQQRDGVSEPNGQSAEFTVQTFVSAKDVYLACSRGLRETIGEIGNRRAMRGAARFPSHILQVCRPSSHTHETCSELALNVLRSKLPLLYSKPNFATVSPASCGIRILRPAFWFQGFRMWFIVLN